MSKTLDILSQETVRQEAYLVESEGELDAQHLAEYEQMNKDLAEKVDHYRFRIRKQESTAEFLRAEAKILLDAAKGIESHVEHMKTTVAINMHLMGRTELCGEIYKFVLRKSPKPAVVVIDSNLIPAQFKKQKIEISLDKEAIAEAIKKGETVEGVRLETREYLAMGNVKKE